ncbi:3,4-dihydroxy-9,10-secoandrosta-1,3,5(10)-triene-9,17-dione 4,5-dioxygenase [Sinobacterium caligoides]|uniref:3,4-dihydroxy-9,10-secoandrosta-1,3, 5(10)-triene-9,17-dione 4,5-dioxygenase n=1 Tax=Sinobacterium caligoides TaxID=933926 RepID=A0A3N2DMX3_9GAMM|nr:VOC family protein [Sinobacterium caligoides]ROS01161.1 3,4-dihydroxy-9,10-secoandrosta-1,3,5(10)-triene-9,17-dione 4,5-dioxygenase [Sinobacterium caligoides]
MKVKSLGYVLIESTDPQNWLEFGTNVVGMMAAPTMPDDGNVYLKMDARPYRFAITKGETDRLLLSGFELGGEEEFNAAKQELEAAGVSFEHGTAEELQARRVKDLVRLQDPSENTIELYWGSDLDYAKFISPVGIAEFETGVSGDMGLGHVVLPAPALQVTHKFYREVLGFGQVDQMHFKFTDDPADPGQGLHFLHVDNPRHHTLALYEAPMPSGCVHLMMEVKTIDEVGYCLDRVQEKEIPIVSTLGRHTNDEMISFYCATPGGFALEFGCGGRQVDWSTYTPTVSTLPSFWGHKFQG